MARAWWHDPALVVPLGLGAVGAAVLYLGRDSAKGGIVDDVKDVFERGRQLTHSSLDDRGAVIDDPEKLRQLASVQLGLDIPRDVYGLGRMIRSEGAAQGRLRAHVALNDLAGLGWASVFSLLTYSSDPELRGLYGQQHSTWTDENGVLQKQTRRYSTAKDPFEGDVQLAFSTIAEHAAGYDPTGGAVKFVDRSSLGGVQAGSGSYEALVERWAKDGLVPFTLPEVGDDFVLFRRA